VFAVAQPRLAGSAKNFRHRIRGTGGVPASPLWVGDSEIPQEFGARILLSGVGMRTGRPIAKMENGRRKSRASWKAVRGGANGASTQNLLSEFLNHDSRCSASLTLSGLAKQSRGEARYMFPLPSSDPSLIG
jgi:hypothetical protein